MTAGSRASYSFAMRRAVVLLVFTGAAVASAQIGVDGGDSRSTVRPTSRYFAEPIIHSLYGLPEGTDVAAISDIACADLDHDGRNDIIVAWFATDYDNTSFNRRFLSIFWGTGTSAEVRTDIDLYVPDPFFEPLSIFRNGSSSIALGDFDGDGDKDIAVLPFFGDEIWFLENLGNRQFHGVVKYPFVFNTTGNFMTPPRALAADVDGDGREDLVYIVDPQFYVDGRIIHFWRTDNTIDNIDRAYWEPVTGSINMTNTRALAIADFDGDGRPDLCFTGGAIVGNDQVPVMTFWTNYNPLTASFTVTNINLDFFVTDMVVLPPAPGCRPSLVLFDDSGFNARAWLPACSGPVSYSRGATIDGLPGGSMPQGVSVVLADVNKDQQPEIIVKQKLGPIGSSHKLDIVQYVNDGAEWTPISPSPIDASSFAGDSSNPLLQPRDLAASDLLGNSLPELVASWGPADANPMPGTVGTLRIAVWQNDCLGDVSLDGHTDMIDLNLVLANYGKTVPPANPDADLNKDGMVGLDDLTLVMGNYGCSIGY